MVSFQLQDGMMQNTLTQTNSGTARSKMLSRMGISWTCASAVALMISNAARASDERADVANADAYYSALKFDVPNSLPNLSELYALDTSLGSAAASKFYHFALHGWFTETSMYTSFGSQFEGRPDVSHCYYAAQGVVFLGCTLSGFEQNIQITADAGFPTRQGTSLTYSVFYSGKTHNIKYTVTKIIDHSNILPGLLGPFSIITSSEDSFNNMEWSAYLGWPISSVARGYFGHAGGIKQHGIIVGRSFDDLVQVVRSDPQNQTIEREVMQSAQQRDLQMMQVMQATMTPRAAARPAMQAPTLYPSMVAQAAPGPIVATSVVASKGSAVMPDGSGRKGMVMNCLVLGQKQPDGGGASEEIDPVWDFPSFKNVVQDAINNLANDGSNMSLLRSIQSKAVQVWNACLHSYEISGEEGATLEAHQARGIEVPVN